jgi:hypothetical protein
MPAKRRGGNDAAVFRAELCNHVALQRAVLGQPVQQDQDGTIPARVFVLYGPRR